MGKIKSSDAQRTRLMTGGLKMTDYETVVKASRLSWLKRIVDVECCGF